MREEDFVSQLDERMDRWADLDSIPVAVGFNSSYTSIHPWIPTFIQANPEWSLAELQATAVEALRMHDEANSLPQNAEIDCLRVYWEGGTQWGFPQHTKITENNLRPVLEFMRRKRNDIILVFLRTH